MNNNKIPQVPSPITEAVDTQMATQTAEADYTYQREDGTIERALSAEDAIARCPVLGRLAIEAPDQANVLLELAAAGKERMKTEANEALLKPAPEQKAEHEQQAVTRKTDAPAKQVSKKEAGLSAAEHAKITGSSPLPIKPTEQPKRQQPSLRTESDTAPAINAATEAIMAKQLEEIMQSESAQNRAKFTELSDTNHDEAVVRAKPKAKLLDQSKSTNDKPKPLASEQASTGIERGEPKRPVKKAGEDAGEFLLDTDHKPERRAVGEQHDVVETAVDLLETHMIKSEVEFIFRDDGEKVVAEPGGRPLDFENMALGIDDEPITDPGSQTLVTEYNQLIVPQAEILVVETEPEQGLSVMFDPETMETYQRLTALTAAHVETETSLEPDFALIDLDESHDKVVTEAAPVIDFETFIALQPTGEEPITFESIKAQAFEQPVEDALVMLAEYLSQPKTENDHEQVAEKEKIAAILHEIKVALPDCYTKNDREEPILQITPEITEKLLLLLRSLGYQQPEDALVNFVANYDLAFLIEALEYVAQLDHDRERKELLRASLAQVATRQDNGPIRVGKMLLNLIIRPVPQPI